MTEQELFAVLDMSKDEQYRWCWRNTCTENGLIKVQWYFLEDLAFRLRDEVKGSEGHEAVNIGQRVVSDYVFNLPGNRPTYEQSVKNARFEEDYKSWYADQAKPIHWIIAALIAKGETK